MWEEREFEDIVSDLRWRFARPEFTKREHYVRLAECLSRIELKPGKKLFRQGDILPEPCLYMVVHGNAWLRKHRDDADVDAPNLPNKLNQGTIFGVDLIEQAEAAMKEGKDDFDIKAPYDIKVDKKEPQNVVIASLSLSDMKAVLSSVAAEKEAEMKPNKKKKKEKPPKQPEFKSILLPHMSDPKIMRGPKTVNYEHKSMLSADDLAAMKDTPRPERKKKKDRQRALSITEGPVARRRSSLDSLDASVISEIIEVETPKPRRGKRPEKKEEKPKPMVDRSTRKNVAQKKIKVEATYEAPATVPKTKVEEEYIRAALEKIIPTKKVQRVITQALVKKLIDAFEKMSIKRGQEFKPTVKKAPRKAQTKQEEGSATVGAPPDEDEQQGFFIVQKGALDVLVDGVKMKEVHEGEYVGELALLVDKPAEKDGKKVKITLMPTTDLEVLHVDPTTYRSILQAETKKEEDNRLALLKKIPFLDEMSEDNRKKLIRAMDRVDFTEGDTVVLKKDYGSAFYVMNDGTIECVTDSSSKRDNRKFSRGDYFGETWLTDRSVKVKSDGDMIARVDGSAFFIDKKTFEEVVGMVDKVVGTHFDSDHSDSDDDTENLTKTDEMQLQGIAALRWDPNKKLTTKQIKKIQNVLRTRKFAKGHTIWSEGEEIPASICFVYAGRAERRTGLFKKKFGRKNFFGSNQFQHARKNHTLRVRNDQPIVARKDTVVGELLLEDYLSIFKSKSKKTRQVSVPVTKTVKRKVSVLKQKQPDGSLIPVSEVKQMKEDTSKSKLAQIPADRPTEVETPKSKLVNKATEKAPEKSESKPVPPPKAKVTETAPAIEKPQEKKKESLSEPKDDITEPTVDLDDALELVEEEEWIEEIVEEMELVEEVIEEEDIGDWTDDVAADDDEPVNVPKRPDRKFDFENISKKVVLGEGQFGQVWLAVDKTEEPPHAYALKIQSKFELVDQEKAEVCVSEQQVMSQMDHPNIIKLFASFQDKHFLYMLLDMINGGELFSIIHAPRAPDAPWGLPEEQSRFYAYVISDAVIYMHKKGYIYRDLKPENVLIGNNGYPTLIDFGFAKKLESNELTFTLCGTPQYIPPEMVLQKGHGFAADHWAIGVVIHEMLCGENPFFCDGMEDMELYRGIMEEDPSPPTRGGHLAHDMIRQLLEKDDTRRLGSLAGGFSDITNHPWFDGLAKRQIQRQQHTAPWVPDLKDAFDVQHFDDWGDLEDKSAQDYPAISPSEEALFEGFCCS